VSLLARQNNDFILSIEGEFGER